jgi:[ribosomal protein S18]-alanine N-acetyltransferase
MSAQPEALWELAPMTEWHLPQVQEIEDRAYPFPWTSGIFRDCLKAGYSAWVVSRDGEVLGYALMSLGVYEAHILNLCVTPECQRQGLGRFLLQHLRRVAAASGAELLLLEVRKSNGAAIALYRKAGFHRLGVRKGYYPDVDGREDAWLLGYRLKPEPTAT